jgi:hypothetical protein
MQLPSASDVNWTRFYKGDQDNINMVKDAYEACTITEAWPYLQKFTPIPGKMLIDDPVIEKITKHMKMFDAHSGNSLDWTFAQILHFAKNGIEYP